MLGFFSPSILSNVSLNRSLEEAHHSITVFPIKKNNPQLCSLGLKKLNNRSFGTTKNIFSPFDQKINPTSFAAFVVSLVKTIKNSIEIKEKHFQNYDISALNEFDMKRNINSATFGNVGKCSFRFV